jgi:predicted DsbA family dithiol-disulfide isomerase
MKKKKTIVLEWQRLVVDKETCPRCGSTEKELAKAIKALNKLGIKVELKKKEIRLANFKKQPQESNKILIAGKPMEEWLSAQTGHSPCCDTCGDAECRTVEYQGQVYETITAELIVQAALKVI